MTLLRRVLDDMVLFNWECSCGATGSEWLGEENSSHPRAITGLKWVSHVSARHPEVEHVV